MTSPPPFTSSTDPNILFYNTVNVVPITMLNDWLLVVTQIAGLSTNGLQLQAQDVMSKLTTIINSNPNVYGPGSAAILGQTIYETLFVVNTYDVNFHGTGINTQLYQFVKSSLDGAWSNAQVSFYTNYPGKPNFYNP